MEKIKLNSSVEEEKSSLESISEICKKYNFIQSSEMVSLRTEIIASPENSQEKIGEWTDRMRLEVDKLADNQRTHADIIGQIFQISIYLEAGFIEDAFMLLDDLFTEAAGMDFVDILDELENLEAIMNRQYS